MKRHPFVDTQRVRIKTKFEDKLVPYKEVRLGMHDMANKEVTQNVVDECRARIGTSKEATVYEIIKERKAASAAKQQKAIKSPKKEKAE